MREEATVISLACQHPEGVRRPEAHMFQRVIVEEAAKPNVELIRSSVQGILARNELRPHKNSYYLFTPKDREDYEDRRNAIVDLYLADLPADEVHVASTRNRAFKFSVATCGATGAPWPTCTNRAQLQAPRLPYEGSVVRPDTSEIVLNRLFERKGYKTSQTISVLRDMLEDLSDFKKVHLIWDNASTHVSKEMRKFLKSEEAACLKVYYTPVHAPWLNAAENFFSLVLV